MKKTYINPAMEIVKVATHQMLAVSSINAEVTGTQSNSAALGRNNDFDWDEFEDE